MLNIDDRLILETMQQIKPNAFAVLLAISVHLNQRTGRAFPSNDRLQKLTGLGRDAVTAALLVLKKNDLLTSHQKPGKGGKFGQREFQVTTKFISIFVTVYHAEPLPEFPYTAEPYTAEPEPDNQGTEQINNGRNKLSKKEQINEFEPLAENEFPPTDEVEFEVTIVEAKKEKISLQKSAAAASKKSAPAPSDGVIHRMVEVFENEHRQHFTESGSWLGFTWQQKEFGALASLRKELSKRFSEKMHHEPSADELISTWSLFLQKAVKADNFVVQNWFTPTKLWGNFASITQKIHAANGTAKGHITGPGKPDRISRSNEAFARMAGKITGNDQ